MTKHTNITDGTILAEHGRVTVTFDRGSVTVPLDVDQSIRVDFKLDGQSDEASIEITRSEARGWIVQHWGYSAVIDSVLSTREGMRVEWSSARGDRPVIVDVREPQDSLYPIRHARGMIERCAALLGTWRDGGKPVASLLDDLRRHSYVE